MCSIFEILAKICVIGKTYTYLRRGGNVFVSVCVSLLGMHDEIFHFEIFKKIDGNFEIF